MRGPPPKDQELCTCCGNKGHGMSAPTRVRRKECPAFGITCNHCNRDHRYGKMCRNRNNLRQIGDGEHENAIFNTLCETTSQDGRECVTLDHHVFDQSTNEWRKRQSKSQPFVRLSVGVQREDYKHFGFKIHTPQPRHLLAPWQQRLPKLPSAAHSCQTTWPVDKGSHPVSYRCTLLITTTYSS